MRDDLRNFAWLHAITKCKVEIVGHFNRLVARDHGGDGNNAAVAWPSTHDVTAVHRDGLTGHIAGGLTAEPQHCRRNLVGAADTLHRYALLHGFHGFTLTLRDHLVHHRCPDEARTYGIDADAAGRIFESCALGEPEHSVLAGMVNSTLGASHQSSKRRAVN